MILETTAGRGTPLVIAVVDIVPVEFRLVTVVEVDIRHLVRPVVAGAACYQSPSIATEDRALPPQRSICSFF